MLESLIPDEWLRREFEKSLTAEELEKIKSLGGLEKLIEAFQKAARRGREAPGEGRQGGQGRPGRRRPGTEGQEGAGGLGQGKKKKAKKVWDERQYKNLDDSVELGTRNIKIALRRLRKFARTGKEEELDMKGTIRATARQRRHARHQDAARTQEHGESAVLLRHRRFDGRAREDLRRAVLRDAHASSSTSRASTSTTSSTNRSGRTTGAA